MTRPQRQAEHRENIHHGHVNGPDTPVVALPFAATTTDVQLVDRDCILMGAAILETTGLASATAFFTDGHDASGSTLIPYTLSAGQSARDTLSSWGLAVIGGLRLHVTAGSVQGVVWVVLP